ncbi:DUF4169 family protein [Sphingomonas sp. H160509]|uniref:DUF4169 family protein n=1 Tax=Sphingomonas sp. H160509 TaxID=2955313 RepID=UPI00406CAD3D
MTGVRVLPTGGRGEQGVGDVINLRLVRKQRARDEASSKADRNRRVFGTDGGGEGGGRCCEDSDREDAGWREARFHVRHAPGIILPSAFRRLVRVPSPASAGPNQRPAVILPRQGEVAGVSLTEGEVRVTAAPCPPPSVAYGATSPWRGRIDHVCSLRRLKWWQL